MLHRAQFVSAIAEGRLRGRIDSPFAPATRVHEYASFGIEALDFLAHGGAPRGAITELVGSQCSGRTTVALHFLRETIAVGSVCAWVDASDAFDPASAAANDVDLQRLLWVRCGASQQEPVQVSKSAATSAQPSDNPHFVSVFHPSAGHGPHPRTEGRDMPRAIMSMLGAHGGLLDHQKRRERRMIGTPGAPNRPLNASAPDRQEQTATDRLPPRRGQHLNLAPRSAGSHPGQTMHSPSLQQPRRSSGPWLALDQALRVTDLLLANGGFTAIVLDLGSTPAEFAWRIPLATWFRYRAACERSRCSLLLLTQHTCARSSAGLVVRLQPAAMQADGAVMSGISFGAEVERNRFTQQPSRVVSIRRPPQPQHAGTWKKEAAWG